MVSNVLWSPYLGPQVRKGPSSPRARHEQLHAIRLHLPAQLLYIPSILPPAPRIAHAVLDSLLERGDEVYGVQGAKCAQRYLAITFGHVGIPIRIPIDRHVLALLVDFSQVCHARLDHCLQYVLDSRPVRIRSALATASPFAAPSAGPGLVGS